MREQIFRSQGIHAWVTKPRKYLRAPSFLGANSERIFVYQRVLLSTELTRRVERLPVSAGRLSRLRTKDQRKSTGCPKSAEWSDLRDREIGLGEHLPDPFD